MVTVSTNATKNNKGTTAEVEISYTDASGITKKTKFINSYGTEPTSFEVKSGSTLTLTEKQGWYRGIIQYFVVNGYSTGYVGQEYSLTVDEATTIGISSGPSTPTEYYQFDLVVHHSDDDSERSEIMKMIKPGTSSPVKLQCTIPEGYHIGYAGYVYPYNIDPIDFVYEDGWFKTERYLAGLTSDSQLIEIHAYPNTTVSLSFDPDRGTVELEGSSIPLEPGEFDLTYNYDSWYGGISPYWLYPIAKDGYILTSITLDGVETELDEYGSFPLVYNWNDRTVCIEFSVALNSITIDGKGEMIEGEQQKMTLVPEPADAVLGTVSWKSSDESVIKVDMDGTVTAVGPGVATLTATVDGVVGTLEITVTPIYVIWIGEFENGKIEIDHTSSAEGTTISFTATPDENYKIGSITVVKEDGTEVELQKTDDGYTFEMPASNVTVNASFSLVEHTVTFKVDGENYHEDTYKHGETIELPTDPSKESTVDTVFEFTGWEGYTENMPATEDHVFNAQFNESVRQYEIDFTMDGTTFRDYFLNYGAVIIAPEDNPTKTETVSTIYTFDHWEGYSEEMTVTGDHTFEAVFSESPRMYDVIFVVDDTVYYEERQAYGSVVEVPADPELSGYDFVGWDGYTTGMTVTSDHTFTAVFEETAVPFPPYFPDDDEWFPVYPGGGGGSADDDITNINPNYPNTGGLTDEELSVLLMTLAIICALFAIFLLILAKRRKDDEEDERS